MVGDLVTTFSNWVRRSTSKIGAKARNSTTFKTITCDMIPGAEINAILGMHIYGRIRDRRFSYPSVVLDNTRANVNVDSMEIYTALKLFSNIFK